MAKIAIYSHSPSDSVRALVLKLNEKGVRVLKMKTRNSRYHSQEDDLVINYGSSNFPMNCFCSGELLNHPESISRTSNKKTALAVMKDSGIKTIEWTTSRDVAESWVDQNYTVYARTVLQGHSGEGIVVVSSADEMVSAPLYTKGITLQRREFRIHVVKGQVVYVQQKKRRNQYETLDCYRNDVRNHHTGWVYTTESVSVSNQAKEEAVKAVKSLGLDFGAVDIITRGNDLWVLEVNTAPGMTGTTLEVYAEAFKNILEGVSLTYNEPLETVADANSDSEEGEVEYDLQIAEPQTEQHTTMDWEGYVNEFVPEAMPDPQTTQEPAPWLTVMPETATSPEVHESISEPVVEQPTPDLSSLINNSIYKIKVGSESTFGMYVADTESFSLIGWDIPVKAVSVVIEECIWTMS